MPNIFTAPLDETPEWRRASVGDEAGCEHLGASVYELARGQAMVFHYHVQREELLIVLDGTLSLRTASGWRDLAVGDVVAFPRGESGAHGYENRGKDPVRVLMVSEMNAPNISVYPDSNEIGIFDAPRRRRRRFGARFRVDDALGDYGGGRARLVPPRDPPRPPE
jgi:uncharacterized cupin superfamily protein